MKPFSWWANLVRKAHLFRLNEMLSVPRVKFDAVEVFNVLEGIIPYLRRISPQPSMLSHCNITMYSTSRPELQAAIQRYHVCITESSTFISRLPHDPKGRTMLGWYCCSIDETYSDCHLILLDEIQQLSQLLARVTDDENQAGRLYRLGWDCLTYAKGVILSEKQ